MNQHHLPILIAATLLVAGGLQAQDGVAPSFDRDVKSILAANCFACHGPDAGSRKAKLRLDVRDSAVTERNRRRAIAPGDAGKSELIARVTSDDATKRMPPAETGKMLSKAQVDTLRKWIDSGAKYEQHWAFVQPTKPKLPDVKQTTWPRNGIDHFVLARLQAAGLSPSPPADRYALIRRVYLDLIGLPPTPQEADAFVNDSDPRAYEKVVDRLLASKHYGERWARPWLDLARYADTNGYEKDRPRSIWLYRDWVINALNNDMPFDRFSIEQLAGDMLPNATPAQRVATGFHRNTMLNEEGGIDPLEFRYYAMVDRVATTGSVWLGLTTGCAQCHTHKYDPITHTDYYRLMALLNNADEPDLIVVDDATRARQAEIDRQIAQLEADLPIQFPPAAGDGPIEKRRAEHLDAKLNAWIEQQRPLAKRWRVLRPTELTSNLPKLEVLQDGSIFSSGDVTKRDVFKLTFDLPKVQPVTALRLEVLPDDRLPARGPGRAFYEGRKGDFFLSELSATLNGNPVRLTRPSHTFGKISIGSGGAKATNVLDGNGSTGWSTAGQEGQANHLVVNLEKPITGGKLEVTMLFERHFAASLGRFRFAATGAAGGAAASKLPVDIEALLATDATTWSAAQRETVQRHFLRTTPELAAVRKKIDDLRRRRPKGVTTMVMQERPNDNPRTTHRHHRGEYLSTREVVSAGLPELFGPTNPGVTNRLELARWLVSKDNPLAARVAVNRAWQAMFGIGLVETSGDFGTQGAVPSYPELLDWLATTFVENGWSFKKLHRLIVTSATYRQSASAPPASIARDPANRMLARGPRFRVPAETVRDIMLRSSGLLSDKVGGPSVFPPQPAAVTSLAYGNFKWRTSTGEDRYRRSLYTFAKRTAPFAAYTTFDGPTGENCVVRRDRSNTPLMALTLLNDAMYLEMAQKLARDVVALSNATSDRATIAFRRVLTRPPTQREVTLIGQFYEQQLKRLDKGELNASTIAGQKNASAELAAWALTCRVIMNLDEAITKP